jgi:uncharacterized protein YxeA
MKKILVLVMLLAFVLAVPMTMAAEKKATTDKVKCCIKGDCKDMTKAECTKAKGKVVTDCKKCKK